MGALALARHPSEGWDRWPLGRTSLITITAFAGITE